MLCRPALLGIEFGKAPEVKLQNNRYHYGFDRRLSTLGGTDAWKSRFSHQIG
jgi:hypothetical protein